MDKKEFITGVERLVDPINVGTLHFMQSFNNFMPKSLQRKLVAKSGQVTPYMGFVVEPYSHFLFYELKDLDMAKGFLPDGFVLRKTKIFDSDEAKYYGIFGCFKAHTSGFWGMRVEFYIIAENQETKQLSWVIVDYDTNTISYDPKNVLSDANSKGLMTTDYDGHLYVDIKSDKGRQLKFISQIDKGYMNPLDKSLWIEGNLSIAYGKDKSDYVSGTFSLLFESNEFRQALRLDVSDISIEVNNWYPGLFNQEPDEVVCFPYAQHFLSDSPGHSSNIKDPEDLADKVENMDFDKIKVFSTKSFKMSFVIGGILSILSNSILLILWLSK